MEEDKSARSDVISWEVMLVLVVRRRKSASHWGEVVKGDVGEMRGLGFVSGAASLESGCDG